MMKVSKKKLKRFTTKYKLLTKAFIKTEPSFEDPLTHDLFNLSRSFGPGGVNRFKHENLDGFFTRQINDEKSFGFLHNEGDYDFFRSMFGRATKKKRKEFYREKYIEIYSNKDKYPTLIKILKGEINAQEI